MEKIRLLVVEDVQSIQKIIDRALPGEVFEKRFASDGRQALEVYKEWRPEIILLDVMLPVLTGFSVLREIREQLGDKSTAIVMQTTLTEKSDILQCMKLGIQGYLVKPFDAREVGRKVLKYYSALAPERAAAALVALEQAVAAQRLETPLPPPAAPEPELPEGKSSPVAEADYLEELKLCLEDGVISEDERRVLERRRKQLGISRKRAAELEEECRAGSGPAMSPEEKEYLEEVKFCLETGPITDGERRILDRLRDKLAIPEVRARELEQQAGAA